MPMVAWYVLSKVSYMNLFVEEAGCEGERDGTPCDEAGLADGLVAEENDFCALGRCRGQVGMFGHEGRRVST